MTAATLLRYAPVQLSYREQETESSPAALDTWQQVLQATAELLSTQPVGAVLVAPRMGMGFFLAAGEEGPAELWCTDWNSDEGLSWDSFTERACDKHFAGEDWAAHVTAELRLVLAATRKEYETVPGLRVQLRPHLMATLAGEAINLT